MGCGLSAALLPRLRVVAHDLVRVAAVGQPDDADVRQAALVRAALDLADERRQLRGAERRRALSGRVDVVGHRDARRVARDELDLRGGERRAERADDVLEALLVGHQGVRVALDEHGHALLADRRLGAVDQVQRAALVEEQRGRRVEVLGTWVPAVFARLAFSLPMMRPPRPVALPLASRMGKMIRPRNRS